MARKPKAPLTVETLRHEDASRKNIPTAEYQSVMQKNEQSPVRVACKGGHDPLDYSTWDTNRETYFGAIRRGLMGDYSPINRLVALALEREENGI